MSVYLPEELYQQARARDLPLSSLTQRAVEQALSDSERADWVKSVRRRERRTDAIVDSSRLVAEVRDEFDA